MGDRARRHLCDPALSLPTAPRPRCSPGVLQAGFQSRRGRMAAPTAAAEQRALRVRSTARAGQGDSPARQRHDSLSPLHPYPPVQRAGATARPGPQVTPPPSRPAVELERSRGTAAGTGRAHGEQHRALHAHRHRGSPPAAAHLSRGSTQLVVRLPWSM